MESYGPRLRAHRSAGLGAAAAGSRAGGKLRIARKLFAAGCTEIAEISAECAVASGELRIACHQARTGLTQGETIEQQPHVGCFSIGATLPETIHERQLTRVLTVVAPVDALLHLRAQLNASTLFIICSPFERKWHQPRSESPRLVMFHVILSSDQQADVPGSRMRLTWLRWPHYRFEQGRAAPPRAGYDGQPVPFGHLVVG